MKNIIISKSSNPFFNLAFENNLFSRKEDTLPYLYLWRNKDVVVVGRFQNPWKECNLAKMEEDSVSLMRRDTGGGAVFHDIENLCFTFVGSTKEDCYREKNSALICEALLKLGFLAEPSGRNDILIDGSKISGAAFRERHDRYIHHGTLLIGTDLTRLANYLNPDKKKLESKGIQSVRSRVTNLKMLNPSIHVDDVIDSIVETFATENNIGDCSIDYVDETLLETNLDLRAEYERLTSWDWCFGKSPSFTHSVDGRFSWGGIEINCSVKNALIENIAVFSDALDVGFVQEITNCLETLKGQAYDATTLADCLETNGFPDIASLF